MYLDIDLKTRKTSAALFHFYVPALTRLWTAFHSHPRQAFRLRVHIFLIEKIYKKAQVIEILSQLKQCSDKNIKFHWWDKKLFPITTQHKQANFQDFFSSRILLLPKKQKLSHKKLATFYNYPVFRQVFFFVPPVKWNNFI